MSKILNRILVIIIILIIFTGCSTTNKDSTNNADDTVTISIYKGKYIDVFDDDTKKDLNKIYGNNINNKVLKAAGNSFPDVSFIDNCGNKVNIDDGPFIFEIVGSWCSYCKALTKEIMPSIIEEYPDITIYQYFIQGTNEDIAEFYDEIGTIKHDNLVILNGNKDMDSWISNNCPDAIPLLLVVDDNMLTGLSAIGLEDIDYYKDVINYTIDGKINEKITVFDKPFHIFQKEQMVVREYINNLEEIKIPKEMLE